MIGKEEALARMLAATRPLDTEEQVPATACRGRISSRPVHAAVSNPPFMCSAMDGYAVDFEKTLEADLDRPVTLPRGSAALPVNTGDPLPSSVNAVIMIEEVEEKEAEIVIRKPAYLWQHVRMTGEDIIEGDILFPCNYEFQILDAGLLLAAGITGVWVRKKPRLLVIPTGHELIDIYEEPAEKVSQKRLIDFNSYTLMALGEEMGFAAEKGPIARTRDDLYAIVKARTGTWDVLVINAGSSAGREDFTEGLIRDLGSLVFHGVTMMPGKPTMFGLIEGNAGHLRPFFGA